MSRTRLKDPDVRMLRKANDAIHATSVRMRRAALEFLWDKWVTHADKAPDPPEKADRQAGGGGE